MEIAEGIWTVENFFSSEECKEYIEFAESIGFCDAPINTGFGKQEVIDKVRNNERAMVDDEERASFIWQRAKEHLPKTLYSRVALGLNERLRFYR
jgi:hypothetical protein